MMRLKKVSTKILIVEDEIDIREGISEYLSEVGYDVMVAEDGQEGIDLFKSNEFDLVLLDIKHINDAEHRKLTGASNKNILAFARYLSDKQIPVWIRHVVVRDITLRKDYLQELGQFIGSLKNVKALDVLPYHNMAIPKYDSLGIQYPLKDIPPTTKQEALWARDVILRGM